MLAGMCCSGYGSAGLFVPTPKEQGGMGDTEAILLEWNAATRRGPFEQDARSFLNRDCFGSLSERFGGTVNRRAYF